MFLFSLQFSKRFYQKSRYYLFFTKFSSLVRKFSHGWMVKYLAFQLFFSTNIDLLILASFFRQWQTHKQYISMDFLVHVYKFFGMQLFPNVALLSANSCWRECVQRKYVGTWTFQEPRCVANVGYCFALTLSSTAIIATTRKNNRLVFVKAKKNNTFVVIISMKTLTFLSGHHDS